MGISYHKKRVIVKSFKTLLRGYVIMLRLVFVYIIYKRFRQILLRVYHNVSFFYHVSDSTAEACCRAYAVKVAKSVTHYKHLIVVADKLQHSLCHHTDTGLIVLVRRRRNTAEELELTVLLDSRLISATSKAHFESLLCKLLALRKVCTISAHTYGQCKVRTLANGYFSCLLEYLKSLLDYRCKVAFLHINIELVACYFL